MKKALKYILDGSILFVLGYIAFTQTNEDVLNLLTAYVIITSLSVLLLVGLIPMVVLFSDKMTDETLNKNDISEISTIGYIRRIAWLAIYSKTIMIGMFYTGLFGILSCFIGWACIYLMRTSTINEIKKREDEAEEPTSEDS